MPNFADVEALLVDFLTTVVGFTHVVTELPGNLTYVMPLVHVERFGGGNGTRPTVDTARVDIDVYAASRVTAKARAEDIRTAMQRQLPRRRYGGTTVARVEIMQAPIHLPYDSRAAVRRFGAAYQLVLHQYVGV